MTSPFRLRALIAMLFLACLLACTASAMAAPPASSPLRVMTFNLRYPSNDDGRDQWAYRKPCVVALIRSQAPDVIALQEAYRVQIDALAAQLPDYAWVGRSRYGDAFNEYTAIFYRRTRLQRQQHGDFWLSQTPDVAGSISWGHPLPRMVTWVQLRDASSGCSFHLFNTHFPWRDEDADARLRSARLIQARIEAIAGSGPVVLAGDFNDVPDSPPHRLFASFLHDAWSSAPQRRGPEGTWHAFKGIPQTRIDWICTRGLRAQRSQTLDSTCTQGRYPSDHFPVQADLVLPAD